jgi:SpoVK/Ycf46/Vps4 family AAA+-type ATPase
VIVDPTASAKASKLGTMTETFTLNTSEIEPFTEGSEQIVDFEGQYLVCAALIEVFSLVDHVWYRVPVPELKLPEWTADPWDQLELSTQRKDLLKTLVNAHTNQLKRSEDVIKKKGKGLVFLFHGQPGLGKTLTAEALSESIQRPLYRVNIGQLAAKVDWEPDLEKIFRDAHSWQAVLLLDEAEVIMEARTKDRMEQNSWCSVFLRKLEYYEGILILTTNMIHSIDKAFRSRINIAIHYDELTLSQKTNLWKLFLGNLPPERAKTKELMESVTEWAKLNLNGRQIRNVVLTAESLALGKAESKYSKMEPSHIESKLYQNLPVLPVQT